MDNIAGMKETGRRLRGPAFELVEIQPEGEDATPHTAIVFNEDYRGHATLTQSVELAVGFMEFPMVAGLVELTKHSLEGGWYVYPTGASRSMNEVFKAFRDIGQAPGVRAGLELCYLGGLILGEACRNGELQGVYSHGSLDPLQVLCRADGQLVIIGHGLPQVDIWKWRESERTLPLHEDSFLYTPPERLEGSMEDVTSDLFSLTLIAYEMMTGKPLYKGTIDVVQRMALRAEGPQILSRDKSLPGGVREFLEQSLQFDPSRRWGDSEEYVAALHELLMGGVEGDPLAEIVRRVFGTERRGSALRSADDGNSVIPRRAIQTSYGVKPRPAPIAPGTVARAPVRPGHLDDEEDEEENRWGKVSRAPKRGDEPAEEDDGRRRRRRRGEPEEAPAPAEDDARRRRRRGEPEEAPAAAEEDGRRRRRRGDADEPAPAVEDDLARRRRRRAEEEPAAEDDSARRRRRRGDDEAAASEQAEAPADDAPRRRTRRGDDEPAAEAAADDTPRRRTRRGDDEPAAETPPAEDEAPRRRTRRGDDEPAAEAPAAEEEAPRRRTRRGGDEEPAAEATAAEAPAAEEEAPRRRTRRGGDEEPAAEAPAAEAPAAEEEAPRRRTRRGGDEEPAAEAPVADAPAPEEEAPRRRTRRGGDEEPAAADAPAEEGERPRRRIRRGEDE